jgi:hypothetical protein
MKCTKLATFAGLAVVALLVACGGAQHPEHSKKRVAFLDIRGANTADLQANVAEMLGDRYEVVSRDEYADAARSLEAKRMRASHVRKVAKHLSVDAVIQGKLSRRSKRRYLLRLRVREGLTGRVVQSYKVPLRKRGLSAKNQRKLERRLMSLLDDIEPVEAPPPAKRAEPVEVAEAEPPAKRERQRETKRTRRAKATAKAEPKPKPKRQVDPDGIQIEDDYMIVERYDDNGQILDDEVPDALR